MSEEKKDKKSLRGTIVSIVKTKETGQNWKICDASLTDGSTIILAVPPDKQIPKEGDSFLAYEGRYNQWQFFKAEHEGGDKPADKSDKGTGSYTKTTAERNEYQEKVRDPKIEFQVYLGHVTNFYSASIPFWDQKPLNEVETDAIIDGIFDKAKALYERANKKVEK